MPAASLKCYPRRSGLSLLETIITLGLLSVVFGMVASLLFTGYRVVRAQDYKTQANQAVQLALVRICNEVREACKIVSTGNHVELLKIDPSANRFNKANRYDDVLRIRYEPNGEGLLLRIAGPPSGTSEVQTLADGIWGLTCSYNPGENFKVTLACNDANQNSVRTYTSEVFPMGLAPGVPP